MNEQKYRNVYVDVFALMRRWWTGAVPVPRGRRQMVYGSTDVSVIGNGDIDWIIRMRMDIER